MIPRSLSMARAIEEILLIWHVSKLKSGRIGSGGCRFEL
jgi:hypothetical protein